MCTERAEAVHTQAAEAEEADVQVAEGQEAEAEQLAGGQEAEAEQLAGREVVAFPAANNQNAPGNRKKLRRWPQLLGLLIRPLGGDRKELGDCTSCSSMDNAAIVATSVEGTTWVWIATEAAT
ncbi:hypothetical protein FNV43_RR26362 [Rhamnella rubrinervis]|uniref:Uncharacterized protein n=1 Tax=Rhamnella rubrinervis TaxID=2594499 RepID=A0A8K0DJK3_9ROSA|nr:hypothetical protein FNV43_RR26362 [Rhamnella rubrinervis]